MRTGTHTSAADSGWSLRQAVIWAGIPFAIGMTLGILTRRSEVVAPPNIPSEVAKRSTDSSAGIRGVKPDQAKLIADKQAQPLLAQLKSTPDDPRLLAKLGNLYFATHNFKEASVYFKRSVDIRDDAIVRTELGRAYFYARDPDNALAEFERVLKSDPDNANALFNVGMVKWQSKSDPDGALAAWQQILKRYPNHPRKAEVELMIALAKQHRALKQPVKPVQPPI